MYFTIQKGGGQLSFPLRILFLICFPAFTQAQMTQPTSSDNIIEWSQSLLLAAKTGEPTDSFVKAFEQMPVTLLDQLVSDTEKMAFWINIYNAYTQIILQKDPERYKKRSRFFGSRQINIGGKRLSLDDIEHGILRRSRIKWSLGYVSKPFPGRFEKKHRVQQLDQRLHFALNCGAKSCPPVAFYDPIKLDKQLNQATTSYLKGESSYDAEKNTIDLPAIMGWFRRDFGGKKGMRALLKKQGIVPADKSPAIRFKQYDWKLFLNNYQTN